MSRIAVLALALMGCPGVGGECTYNEYPGTCTGEGEGNFTFEGDVDGVAVTLAGNGGSELAEGESTECTLSYIETGTCSPCEYDIGGCGDETWDIFRPEE